MLLDNIDDKYFAKYRGAGSGLNAAAGSSGGTAAVAGGQKVSGDKKATGATAAAATAGGAVAAVASKTKSATVCLFQCSLFSSAFWFFYFLSTF